MESPSPFPSGASYAPSSVWERPRRPSFLGRFVPHRLQSFKKATAKGVRKWKWRRKFKSSWGWWFKTAAPEAPEASPSSRGASSVYQPSRGSSKDMILRRIAGSIGWETFSLSELYPRRRSPAFLGDSPDLDGPPLPKWCLFPTPSPSPQRSPEKETFPFHIFPLLDAFTDDNQSVPASPSPSPSSSRFAASLRYALFHTLLGATMASDGSVAPAPGRFPPRSSSLQTAADEGTLGVGPANFEDFITRHPELDGKVIQTNVVRAPKPRVNRVAGGLRNAFALRRSPVRPQPAFEILSSSTESSGAVKPAGRSLWKSASASTLRSLAHPLASLGSATTSSSPSSLRSPSSPLSLSSPAPTPAILPPAAPPVVTPVGRDLARDQAVQEVQRGLERLTRLHEQVKSRQRRKMILDDIIKLHSLLSAYQSREDRCKELEGLLAMYRGETALHRRGLIQSFDQAWERYNDLVDSHPHERGRPTERQ